MGYLQGMRFLSSTGQAEHPVLSLTYGSPLLPGLMAATTTTTEVNCLLGPTYKALGTHNLPRWYNWCHEDHYPKSLEFSCVTWRQQCMSPCTLVHSSRSTCDHGTKQFIPVLKKYRPLPTFPIHKFHRIHIMHIIIYLRKESLTLQCPFLRQT